MHHVVKQIIAFTLFLSVLATPKLAFDYVRSPVSLDSTLTLHVVKNHVVKTSVRPLSELQKIAAQVREWPSTPPLLDPSLKQEIGATASSASWENEDNSEEEESEIEEEEAPEIIKLDKVFFDYVMNTYVKRIRTR
jgi:hypothetical protein